MSTPNQDFEVTEGASFTINVPLFSNGAIYALPAGAVVHWWASRSQFDPPDLVTLKKSTTAGTVSVVTAAGQSTVYVLLSNIDTVGLGQKKLFHQARATFIDGTPHPLFSGTMTVLKRLVV